MTRLSFAAAAAALAVTAQAQTTPSPAYSPVVFSTVDAVSVEASRVVVTGIVQGQTVASQWYASQSTDTYGWAQNCQRAALLAMAKPGQYLLEIRTSGGYAAVCKLTRVAP